MWQWKQKWLSADVLVFPATFKAALPIALLGSVVLVASAEEWGWEVSSRFERHQKTVEDIEDGGSVYLEGSSRSRIRSESFEVV